MSEDHTASRDHALADCAVTRGQSHTPGPWSFEALCFGRKIPIRGGATAYGRPYTIAHVNRPGSAYSGQDKANACLIAAAPDLLERLKIVTDTLAHLKGEDWETIKRARAAIAKAEGK